jgi:hypothetical protein
MGYMNLRPKLAALIPELAATIISIDVEIP